MNPPAARHVGSSGALAVGALVAFVFAARAWLIRDYGSPVPYWDQWDAEAVALYPNWRDGTLDWRQLFAPHNEHRIALTRLADLALFVVCGGWNPWAQLLFNAALHAATAGALAAIFWPAQNGRERAWFISGLAVVFAGTAGWQNALWGFQSQVYFGNLLAVVAIAGLEHGRVGSRAWWIGWSALLLALFANAGGVLVPFAALALALLRVFRSPEPVRAWAGVAAIATVAALGVALLVTPPHHAGLRARTLAEFGAVFGRCLSWPQVNLAWPAPLLLAPLIVLLFACGRGRRPFDAATRCATALAFLALLHAAAVAASRGAGLIEYRPISRYQDPLLLGIAAQFFAAGALARLYGRPARMLLLGWLAFFLVGFASLTAVNLRLHLPHKRSQDAASLRIVRDYATTRDPAVFRRDPRFPGPNPDPAAVMRVLDDPRLRRTLPAGLLAPDHPQAPPPAVVRHAVTLTVLATVLLLLALARQLRASRSAKEQRAGRPRPRPEGSFGLQ